MMTAVLFVLLGGTPNAAALEAWTFMQNHEPETPEFERAEHDLALALDELGYPHAAQELWISVGIGRRDARLLGPALVQLSEGALRRPYDAQLTVDRLLAHTEFGYVPAQAADFVSWQQGNVDIELGYVRWGQSRIDSMREGSPWWYMRAYREAIRTLDSDDLDALSQADIVSETIQRRIELARARLAYERQDYEAALLIYETLDVDLRDSAPIILERAWCYYWLRKSSKALGLLVALRAPIFEDFVDPETYLLGALLYKDLCHYDAAQVGVAAFRDRFADTLEAIEAREDLSREPTFRALAQRHPSVLDAHTLVTDLTTEQRRLESAPGSWHDNGLVDFLTAMYRANQERAEREYQRVFRAHLSAVGDRILDATEQMNVVSYEIELARNRRGKAPVTDSEVVSEVPRVATSVFYRFEQEFWTDELEDLIVIIESKCQR